MSDFPKWLLALAFLSLLPVVLSPFYLFAASPFGTSDSGFVRFLLYIATQLLWLIPLLLFFFSLDLYRRGYEKTGIGLCCISDVIALAGALMIFI